MNQSVINLCNLALARMGGNQIKHISDLQENSEEARHCKRLYPQLLQNLLRRHPFAFACKQQALALVDMHPGQAMVYEYAYPADCLQLWQVDTEPFLLDYRLPKPPYQLRHGQAQTTLFCNVPQAFACYSGYVDDPNRFDPLFSDALAWSLAAELCLSLRNDAQLYQALTQRALMAIDMAMATDANEGSQQTPEPYFITSRY